MEEMLEKIIKRLEMVESHVKAAIYELDEIAGMLVPKELDLMGNDVELYDEKLWRGLYVVLRFISGEMDLDEYQSHMGAHDGPDSCIVGLKYLIADLKKSGKVVPME